MSAKHTPFREALMRAWVQGWYDRSASDEDKIEAADEIVKDFPCENMASELLIELQDCTELLEYIHADLGPHHCTVGCPDISKRTVRAHTIMSKSRRK